MENDLACIGVTCTIPAGKHVNSEDWGGLPNDVMLKVMQRKVERLKSLKAWRSMSYILQQCCNKTFDSYAIPSSCTLRRPMAPLLPIVTTTSYLLFAISQLALERCAHTVVLFVVLQFLRTAGNNRVRTYTCGHRNEYEPDQSPMTRIRDMDKATADGNEVQD